MDLALQGGGAHGAFTWGVLERLLEDERIQIEALSGTSAGAMNAVVFADGYASGGRARAAAALGSFWKEIAQAGGGFSMRFTPFDALFRSVSPLYKLYDVISRFVSPYQANPFNINPLREILARHVDFHRLRGFEGVKVFICATNVRSGHHRVFRNAELTLDAVLASACLPVFLLGAVFARFMEDSGAALVLSRRFVDWLGERNAVLAIVLACAVLTYGGVSLFVVAFAVYPIATAMFAQANIPKRLIPATIALGAFTFTMTALPGTPAIQNAIPMPFFNTTPFAAPGLGLIGGAIMFGVGMLWLWGRAARAHSAGEGYADVHGRSERGL
jgi:hypothetical protein